MFLKLVGYNNETIDLEIVKFIKKIMWQFFE